MAFHTVKKGTSLKEALTNAVTLSKYFKGGGMCIRISRDLVDELGNPPFVYLQVGTGEHDGMVLVTPAVAKGKFAYKVTRQSPKGAGQIGISPSKIGLSNSTVMSTTKVPHELSDGGLIFRVPNIAHMAVAAE